MTAVHGTHTKAVMRILSVDDSEGLEEEVGVGKEWDVLVDMEGMEDMKDVEDMEGMEGMEDVEKMIVDG